MSTDIASSSWIRPAASASYPPRRGNAVTPLIDGEPAFRRIAQAVERATSSVWVTVPFVEEAAAFPDGRGSVFDVLGRAAERGLDVRALFWHEPEIAKLLPDASNLSASEAARALLTARSPRLKARWDQVPRYCHHQKSWLVDAGRSEEIAFVGGINIDRPSIVAPGHRGLWMDDTDEGSVHDVYLELRGPAGTDVHHNFVQRWNGASERESLLARFPDATTSDDLAFPSNVSAVAGDVTVQITRSVLPGLYRDGSATPGGQPFSIADGESSVLEQYLVAIEAARATIYLENQTLVHADVLAALDAALARGVEVIALVPRRAMAPLRKYRDHPRVAPLFEQLSALGRHRGFTLASPVARRPDGTLGDVYVHAKLALVDDAWATIGSTNVLVTSFHGDTEMNASFWHGPTVRRLRNDLFAEHLFEDVSDLDEVGAFARYRDAARRRGALRDHAGEPVEEGATSLDPASWGLD